MGGGDGMPAERASPPLKRRASSLEPETGSSSAGAGGGGSSQPAASSSFTAPSVDVEMHTAPTSASIESMIVDTPQPENDPEDVSLVDVPIEDQAVEQEVEDDTQIETIDRSSENYVPSLHEQIKTITTLCQALLDTPLKEGDKAYLVSKKWLGRAQALGAGTMKPSKDGRHEPLGPVDNSDIIQASFKDANGVHFVQLKPEVGMGDVEMFPEDAWTLVIKWHGLAEGQRQITRIAHNTNPSTLEANFQYELHPPVFTIHRLWSAHSSIPVDAGLKNMDPTAPVIVHSSSFSYMKFLAQAKKATFVPLHDRVRLWRVPPKLAAAAPTPTIMSLLSTPPDSPSDDVADSGPETWDKLLLDVESFLKLAKDVERFSNNIQDETNNPNYNGHLGLRLADLNVSQHIVLDEQITPGSFVSTYTPQSNGKEKAVATRSMVSGLGATTRSSLSGRSSPAPSGPLTRGRAQQKSGRTVGTVGLTNLGNTCYMNSALQCVRSVEELTKYFLSHEAENEVNRDNPLAHNGEVADAYGRLLEDIYRYPSPPCVTPRHFKSTIGRYAPAFSGYGQQDSQEFLGFLLDGLQEDLSRVKKKPYIEKPDSTDDMINNQEAIREMANKVWDITKRRDDSVIADLFTGMYKSTLVCPVCAKISITFDPFNNLTLPLPVENNWNRVVKFLPLNDAPVEIEVDVDKHSSIKAMKQFISVRTGVPAERLIAAEEFREKFFKVYEDLSPISDEIQANDVPVVYELESQPTNWPNVSRPKQPRIKSLLNTNPDDDDANGFAWDDPMAERMVVPVIHRAPGFPTSQFNRRIASKKAFIPTPVPHFIVVTPEEARSEDAIRRKILEKVATFSTWSGFAVEDEDDNTENTDPEMVVNASDADSAGDSKIIAQSIGSEEDMVDVTMKDTTDTQASKAAEKPKAGESKVLKEFNGRRPKWVDPREYLAGSLQNLFEMSYFTETSGSFNTGPVLIPSGWRSVEDDQVYPKLSSRVPPPSEPSDDQDAPTPSSTVNGVGTDAESGSEDSARQQASVQTRMTEEETSDEDAPLPAQRQNLPVRTNNGQRGSNRVGQRGRKKNKNTKTYSKKAQRNKRRTKQGRAGGIRPVDGGDGGAAFDDEGGPLIRLGEGIVVDWNEAAWELVYGSRDPADMMGQPTYANIEKLADPALDAKKKSRVQRRKHGITLDDCLDEFEKEEILSEQDTWYCPRCKEHRRASKKFELWKTPDILVVHLKRFSSAGYRRDKLDVTVNFPVEDLDLRSRVIDQADGKQEVYDLIAVDDHWGGLGGGHYTAFAKNFIDNKWYEYNDSSVSRQENTNRIVSAGAYLLFYRRRSEAPLGGPRFKAIFDKFNSQYDEEMSEAGEGQRLGIGSSLRGSSSALIGADPTRPQAEGGSVRSMVTPFLKGSGDELPPPYQSPSLSTSFDHKASSLAIATTANATTETIHTSVEEDEAIALNDVFLSDPAPSSQVYGPQTWDWKIKNNTRSSSVGGQAPSVAEGDILETEYHSDKAQHDSPDAAERFRSVDADIDADADGDLINDDEDDEGVHVGAHHMAVAHEETASGALGLGRSLHAGSDDSFGGDPPDNYVLPPKPEDVFRDSYVEPDPPTPHAQALLASVTEQVWRSHADRGEVLEVRPGDDDDDDSMPADDIHVSQDEDVSAATLGSKRGGASVDMESLGKSA